ncbi:MAG: alpha/beta hydrolase [Candidatus Cloacimonetes bacterium]|nr:alpha/beta hydrolase [Candidatus Cloacimonadota bacterium]
MPQFLGQRYIQLQFESEDFGIVSERITLMTDDSLLLAAWRTQVEESKGTVIIISGLQNPSVTAFFGYAKMLSNHGWDSLLIEKRARSQSAGDEIGFGMTEWRDVNAGVSFLLSDEHVGYKPIVVMGTSMGAGTAIIAAGEIPVINAVIALSSPSKFSDLWADNTTLYGFPRIVGLVSIPFVEMYLGFKFGFYALRLNPTNGIMKLDQRPILLMQSTQDTQVPFRQFVKLLKNANDNGINVTTFVRDGDWHFICYDQYFDNPIEDIQFSKAIFDFLDTVR